MSHPGVSVDPSSASAEFAAFAAVLGVPTDAVGAGSDPCTATALTALGSMTVEHELSRTAATTDQSAAGSAGGRTVGGYVTTESQNESALSNTETTAV